MNNWQRWLLIAAIIVGAILFLGAFWGYIIVKVLTLNTCGA